MKRYLVTGAHGWLASELERRLATFPGHYQLDKVSVRGDDWKQQDWSVYDGVFHFALIKDDDYSEARNVELSQNVAEKCCKDKVPWLLYMSTFHVYGAAATNLFVDATTRPTPSNSYGRAKLASEEVIVSTLQGSTTKLAIVRTPLIYGPGQRKSNFQSLIKLSAKVKVFPQTCNTRSMIYSQNLCELCRLLADDCLEGTYLPQDSSYYDTAELVREFGALQANKVHILSGMVPLCHALTGLSPKLAKLFGSACYELSASEYDFNYRIATTKQALVETLGGDAK